MLEEKAIWATLFFSQITWRRTCCVSSIKKWHIFAVIFKACCSFLDEITSPSSVLLQQVLEPKCLNNTRSFAVFPSWMINIWLRYEEHRWHKASKVSIHEDGTQHSDMRLRRQAKGKRDVTVWSSGPNLPPLPFQPKPQSALRLMLLVFTALSCCHQLQQHQWRLKAVHSEHISMASAKHHITCALNQYHEDLFSVLINKLMPLSNECSKRKQLWTRGNFFFNLLFQAKPR